MILIKSPEIYFDKIRLGYEKKFAIKATSHKTHQFWAIFESQYLSNVSSIRAEFLDLNK